jgi:hypothetical protein
MDMEVRMLIYSFRPARNTICWLLLFTSAALAQQHFPVIEEVDKGHAVGHEQDGVDAVRAALIAGGEVNELDKAGWTPLMHAALECRANIVKLLLDHGADVNIRGDTAAGKFPANGQTALLLAAGCFIARRRAQLAPERSMPPDYGDYELAAPAKMVRDLLTHGADPTIADSDGRTPLMMATMHGWPDVVEELLRAHVSVNTRDRAGLLAIDYADPANKTVIDLLNKAGSPDRTGHSGRTVCDAEQALELPIQDCINGQEVTAAVKKFQQEHALTVTGQLDGPTLKALGIRD